MSPRAITTSSNNQFSAASRRKNTKRGRKEQIFAAGLCTASHPQLQCSYRRDWKDAGRMAASIRARDGERR